MFILLFMLVSPKDLHESRHCFFHSVNSSPSLFHFWITTRHLLMGRGVGSVLALALRFRAHDFHPPTNLIFFYFLGCWDEFVQYPIDPERLWKLMSIGSAAATSEHFRLRLTTNSCRTYINYHFYRLLLHFITFWNKSRLHSQQFGVFLLEKLGANLNFSECNHYFLVSRSH